MQQHDERITTIENIFNDNWEKIEERLLAIEQHLTGEEEEGELILMNRQSGFTGSTGSQQVNYAIRGETGQNQKYSEQEEQQNILEEFQE